VRVLWGWPSWSQSFEGMATITSAVLEFFNVKVYPVEGIDTIRGPELSRCEGLFVSE